LDMIPYFGHYLAVPVLYVCIALITRADLFPDAVFTVVIAYALMFCLNMFLLAGLLGDLRPSVTVQASKSGDTSLVAGQEMDEKAATTPERPVKADAAMKDAPKPNALAAAQAVPGPKSAESGSATNEVAQKFSLKGITRSSSRPLATVFTGTSTYTVEPGEWRTMRTPNGVVTALCDEVGEDWVILTLNGARVKLGLR